MVRIVRAGTTARRVAAAVPVIALATAGIAFAATRGGDTVAPTSAITVPDQAITGGSPLYPQAGPAPAPMQLPPIYQTFTQDYARVGVPAEAQGAITAIESLAPVRLDANGIPAAALAAYQRAAGVLDGIKPGCGIDWALLGAIGRVESNHAQYGGNVLDGKGIARPGIIGIPLNGSNGTARITDTDGGALDHDPVYDRAVGPMQFIPSSWRVAGRDADGDGVANPQSLTDAVTGAGVLLCSGGTDLRKPGAAYSAVLRYNQSDAYVRTVLSIADAYRRGVTVVPMSALPAARPAAGTGTATPDGSGFAYAGSPTPQSTASPSADPTPRSSAKPSPSPSSSKPAPTTAPAPKPKPNPAPAPSTGVPGLPVPLPPLPSLPSVPLPPVPVPSVPGLPSPTLPAEIVRLLALPHLLPLPGDPTGLVRVLDPLHKNALVCVLADKVVTCPSSGGLL